ncbi:MAG TPA: PSD1 and planctomycete cytochrome C domain-containing protein [Humisphaera sp.]|jgi:hypothetical protein|nr:PSD1 and planctomycete cytochrome C domain-containing protein [Humisphaera sp.]
MGTLSAALIGLTRTHADDAPVANPGTIDFVRDIQPILKNNCYKCHGADKQKGQIRFDSRESVLAGGQTGKAIEPGKGQESRLIHRVMGLDGDDRMPLKSDPLSDKQIALLKSWIDQGAKWPDGASVADATIERHWAYMKPKREPLPKVSNEAWCRNPIDYYILARLDKEGLTPSKEADRTTLIRRVSLDLIGLPPTLKEVDDFLNDTSPDAYEKVVDRLLASPHYGERQGIHWLDLARYADSNGYEKDRQRSMWPYRDWVINAYNSDMPFDEFTIEQLAGDLLPDATLQQKIASGFNRNTMLNEEGGVDPDEYFYYALVDRVNTTSTVWLGSTINCSQCHNHKYDPFTQKDYYRLMAYFNSTAPETTKGAGSDPHDVSARVTVPMPQVDELQNQIAQLEKKLTETSDLLTDDQAAWEQTVELPPTTLPANTEQKEPAAAPAQRPARNRQRAPAAKIPDNIITILRLPRDERDDKQLATVASYYRTIAPRLESTRTKIAELKKRLTEIPKTSLVMQELPKPRQTYVHIRGAFLSVSEKVQPATPVVLTSATSQVSSEESKTANRLDLARWLVSTDNPLTARVTVNRIWEQYFGKGIVATSEDFGTQGEPPINQPLLDWLACEFMKPANGQPWSMKAVHRLIVTSAAYRQSSAVTPALLDKDPYNRLLARGARFRLPAELIRDQALFAGGLLSEKMGGPSVFPLQPDGIWHLPYSGDKWVNSEGEDRYRRGIYTFQRRSSPYPEFVAFDKMSLEAICTRRSRTDTPLQALTTLNDPAFMQPAAALARRAMTEGGDNPETEATFAFRTILARTPTVDELKRLTLLYDQMLENFSKNSADAEKVARGGLPAPAKNLPAPQLAAWTMVCNVLLNLDETLTKQ